MDSSINPAVSWAAPAQRCDRFRTSSATTAKPIPASPARAASTAAFNARILVWNAISSITLMIFEILPLESLISFIDATYIKVLDEIRRLYTQLPEAKAKGFEPGRFSFNVSGGRCEACEGNGSTRLEMDFLADIWVTCPVCEGHRFNRETLQVRYKGKSIAEVLEMDIQEALTHFENIPPIAHKLQTLHDVGLDYMKLGQPSPTLSGGEA